ncbi:MAG: hypothetical protein KIS90_10110 [Phenylobacterium sp.]|nr:hypothetical protein [Phenylobacterium sp.]
MSEVVLPWMTVTLLGSSWVGGRLQAWADRFAEDLPKQPEAKGPIRVFNLGQGGFTSSQILAQKVPLACALKSTHVFIDPGHVNSAADTGGGPAVSRAQTLADLAAMVAALRADNPGVIITLCTMNSISAASLTIHPAYADYVADLLAYAALEGLDVVDTYALQAHPLDPALTYGAGAFAIAPTATFLALPDGAGWNAADKASNVVLTHVEAGAVVRTAGIGNVRGNTALAGKRHFEWRVDLKGGSYPAIGVANAAASLTAYVGADNNGLALFADGNVYRNGANQGAAFSVAAGDVIGVEIDVAAKLAYFMKGVTRTAGFDLSALGAGPLYPAASKNAVGSGGLARFTPSGDGLHLVDRAEVDAHLYGPILTHYRGRMAGFWPA